MTLLMKRRSCRTSMGAAVLLSLLPLWLLEFGARRDAAVGIVDPPQVGGSGIRTSRETSVSGSSPIKLCVLSVTCSIRSGVSPNHNQLQVVGGLASDADVLPQPSSGAERHYVFVVEDGCAMGHMLKDIGVVLHIATAKTISGGSLHIVFGNSCAQRASWGNVERQRRGRSDSSGLFSTILGPWWFSAVELLSGIIRNSTQEAHPRTLPSSVNVVFADEWGQWVAQYSAAIRHANVVVLRRPVQWRWFYQPADAALFREFVVRGILRSLEVAHSGYRQMYLERNEVIRITVIKRRKNRRFGEDLVGGVAQGVISPWLGKKSAQPPLRVQVVDPTAMSFEDQVLLFASTDVLVAAHGAALASTMFMERGTVVEIFPYHFGYWIYEELALAVGLEHHIVRGARPSAVCSRKRLCSASSANNSLDTAGQHDVYVALREWNGHSSCKNCDVMWCQQELLDENVCLRQRMAPLFRDTIRKAMMRRIRRGVPVGPVNTTRWIDRRS